jgi:hypothetical protein
MLSGRTLTLVDARDPRVETTWRLLESQAQPPYFLSWGWVESWLAALPTDQLPPLALIRDDGAPVAAFFLGHRRLRRHLVMTSSALYLNTTGSPRHDELCIEHNGVLALPGTCRSLAELVALLPGEWDELYLPAIDSRAFEDLGARALAGSGDLRVHVERETPAPFVDLEAVRGVGGDYVALLGASTRSQLRRARRITGELQVEVASDHDHALDIYGELLRLHARRWNSAGQRGAFHDPWFERFHRRLIQERFRHGEIQLMRLRAGDTTLGCLYNLVSRGRVLFYQCGLAASDDPRVKPGFLCHAAAIEHNARAGHAIYDLLGGGGRYKQQLSTGAHRLVWLRLHRPRVRFAIEHQIKRCKRVLLAAAPQKRHRDVDPRHESSSSG